MKRRIKLSTLLKRTILVALAVVVVSVVLVYFVDKYSPTKNSITSGQVLHCPYNYQKTKLIIKEMADLLAIDLVSKKLVTDQLILTIGYDIENLTSPNIKYDGPITTDQYGRSIPKHAHGTINIDHKTSSSKIIMEHMLILFDRIINKKLLVRRINMVASNLINEEIAQDKPLYQQFDLFTNQTEVDQKREQQKKQEQDEKRLQHILIDIKNKYGKNAILKGINLEEGGTTIERNCQIGGHKE